MKCSASEIYSFKGLIVEGNLSEHWLSGESYLNIDFHVKTKFYLQIMYEQLT